ncbi:hypothetical protein GTO27_06275 [Candidatus Bathyarchaeota archaeon]|nr:hypothetical protein [Candidatus Bathyarchaeota archaeon]
MGFVEDFFVTMQTYNETILPITLIAYLLGIFAIYLCANRSRRSSKVVSLILAFLWFWSGIVFHIVFYGPVNVEILGQTMSGVWYGSGVLFLVQGLLFLVLGVGKSSLSFGLTEDAYSITGAIVVTYALMLYPLIGLLTGFNYPRYPLFGAPCPVNIFSVGVLLWADRKVPSYAAIIPLIWSVMGLMPVLVLSVWADIGLILSGIIGVPLILFHNRKLD